MTTGIDRPVPAGGGVWWDCAYQWHAPASGCDAVNAKDPEQAGDCCYVFGGNTDVGEHCNVFVYYYPKLSTRRVLQLIRAARLFGCWAWSRSRPARAGARPPPPAGCFVGDRRRAPMIDLVHQTAERTLAPVTDGGSLPLIVPPQGGEVLIVGVRALNIDGCPLTMSTSLALPNGVVAAFERRPVTLQAGRRTAGSSR